MTLRKAARIAGRIIINKPTFIWDICLMPLVKVGGNFNHVKNLKSLYKTINQMVPIKIKISSSFDSISVESKDYFYKLPLTSEAENKIRKEYQCWREITKNETVRELFPDEIEIEEIHDLIILKVKKYKPLENAEFEQASAYLLGKMRKNAIKSDIYKLDNIEKGMRFIEGICDAETAEGFINKIGSLKQSKLMTGLVHGDFHYRNILKAEEQKYILIDLDRVSMQGLQALDAVHYIVDAQSRNNKIPWPEQLIHNHLNNWDIGEQYKNIFDSFVDIDKGLIVYIYFLERIGKELTEDSIRSRYWMSTIEKFIEKFPSFSSGEDLYVEYCK